MTKKLILFYSTIICFMYSCAPARYVKPLDKKQQAVNLSLGGPLIKYGKATIPVPFLTANYGYGIDSSLTVFASLNVTSALFGNVQTELGATKSLFKQNGYFPAVSVTPVANVIYRNRDAHKLYPQLDINAYWDYNKRKNFFYIGVSNWFELKQKRAFDVRQPNHWIFSPLLGHSFSGTKWNFNIEAKLIAPNLSNRKIVAEYQTPLKDHGAFGIYLGYTRKF